MPVAEPTALPSDAAADRLTRFESVGGLAGAGDEFSLVQQAAGLAPRGLLCRAEMPETTVVRLLETRLDGVGGEGNILVGPCVGSDQWWTRDPRFPLAVPSGIRIADQPLLGMTERIRRQWRFLREDLLERLGRRDAILVFRGGADGTLPALDAALRHYPAVRLLCVRSSEQPGAVRAWSDRVLVANLPLPAPGAPPDHAGWRAICQDALALVAGTPPLAAGGSYRTVVSVQSEIAPDVEASPSADDTDQRLRAAVVDAPGSAEAHDALGQYLLDQNRLSDAIEAWTAALAITPHDLGRLTHLGGVLLKAGQFAAAAALFKRAAIIAPHSLGVANQHLVALQRAGDVAGALAAARRIVVLDPDNPRRLLQLASVLALANDLVTAEDVTRQAIAMDPKLPDSRLMLSGLLAQRGEHDAALAEARQALALQPRNTRALGQVGRLAGRQGRFEEAEAALTQAAALEPTSVMWQRLLADVRQRRTLQPGTR